MTGPTLRYFAYGSNLTLARMRSRVAGARADGVAYLHGYRLAWDKLGADGSGKANLRREPESRVWGVVYAFESDGWGKLDAHERGYERFEVLVTLADAAVPVQTYRSERLTGEPPFAWYRQLVVEGARAHGLPEDWVRALEACPVRPDR